MDGQMDGGRKEREGGWMDGNYSEGKQEPLLALPSHFCLFKALRRPSHSSQSITDWEDHEMREHLYSFRWMSTFSVHVLYNTATHASGCPAHVCHSQWQRPPRTSRPDLHTQSRRRAALTPASPATVHAPRVVLGIAALALPLCYNPRPPLNWASGVVPRVHQVPVFEAATSAPPVNEHPYADRKESRMLSLLTDPFEDLVSFEDGPPQEFQGGQPLHVCIRDRESAHRRVPFACRLGPPGGRRRRRGCVINTVDVARGKKLGDRRRFLLHHRRGPDDGRRDLRGQQDGEWRLRSPHARARTCPRRARHGMSKGFSTRGEQNKAVCDWSMWLRTPSLGTFTKRLP